MPYIGRVRNIDLASLRPDPVELADNYPMDRPVSLPEPPTWRQPTHERFTFANPAAGANSANLRIVPGESWEMLEFIRMLLTTDATVANRLVSVRYMDAQSGGQVYYEAITPINCTASLQWQLQFGVDEIPITAVAQNQQRIRLPQLALPPGWLMRIQIQSVAAGDQLSAIFFSLRRWRSGRAHAFIPPDVA